MLIYQIVFHVELGYVKVTICHLYYLQYIYMIWNNLYDIDTMDLTYSVKFKIKTTYPMKWKTI